MPGHHQLREKEAPEGENVFAETTPERGLVRNARKDLTKLNPPQNKQSH